LKDLKLKIALLDYLSTLKKCFKDFENRKKNHLKNVMEHCDYVTHLPIYIFQFGANKNGSHTNLTELIFQKAGPKQKNTLNIYFIKKNILKKQKSIDLTKI